MCENPEVDGKASFKSFEHKRKVCNFNFLRGKKKRKI
jgi:hypothetical protein